MVDIDLNQEQNQFTPLERDLFQNEPSRIVKIFFLKFKCIVVFSLILVSFLQFLYILISSILKSDESVEKIQTLLRFFEKVGNMENGSSYHQDLGNNL